MYNKGPTVLLHQFCVHVSYYLYKTNAIISNMIEQSKAYTWWAHCVWVARIIYIDPNKELGKLHSSLIKLHKVSHTQHTHCKYAYVHNTTHVSNCNYKVDGISLDLYYIIYHGKGQQAYSVHVSSLYRDIK